MSNSLYLQFHFSLTNKSKYLISTTRPLSTNMTSILKTSHPFNGGVTNTPPVEAKRAKLSDSDVNGNHLNGCDILQNGGDKRKLPNGGSRNKDKCAPSRECGEVDLKDVLKRRHMLVG